MKKTKISKKDLFRLNKKAKKGSFFAPGFLLANYSLTEVTDDGIFLFKQNIANKLYEISLSDYIDGEKAYGILRNLDAEFSTYYYSGRTYLLLSIQANNIAAAMESFSMIESEIFKNLARCSVELEALSFGERMALIHEMMVNGLEDKRVSISDYHTEASGYKEDFLLQEYDTLSEDFLKTNTETLFQIAYVRKLKKYPNDMLKEVLELPFVEVCKIGFECIPDKAVVSFIENTYMGFEKELKIINKNNPDLYDIFTSPKTAEDKKQFAMCGIMLLLKHEDSSSMEENYSTMASLFKKYDCSFELCFGNLLQQFLTFVPFQTDVAKQYRLMQGNMASSFFLAGKLNTETESEPIPFEKYDVRAVPQEIDKAFEYTEEDLEPEELKEASSVFDYLI